MCLNVCASLSIDGFKKSATASKVMNIFFLHNSDEIVLCSYHLLYLIKVKTCKFALFIFIIIFYKGYHDLLVVNTCGE